ncbi:MAG: hypothetical protein ACXABH_11810 [Candidatus Thorarchaeota archaeon]|jgi:hypothetical protein
MNIYKKLLCVLLAITFLTMPLGIDAISPIGSASTTEMSAVIADDEYNFGKRNDPVSVLVYNEYMDLAVDGEWDNMMGSLEPEYGYTFDYWNLTDHTFLDSNYLDNYDILIIGEQELANATEMDAVAAAWSGFIGEWVLGGGVIISMDYWCDQLGDTSRILNGTGLMGIYNVTDQAYNPVTVSDPYDPLAFGVSAYTGADGTISFDTPDGNEILGAGGQTVVAHRYLGLGHVVMLGFDMFEIEGNQTVLLTNAVRLTRLAVFDNSHGQVANPFSGFTEFATHIQENYGFAIATMNSWEPTLISSSEVLVASNNFLTFLPYNVGEVTFIRDYVEGGGGLLITSDIWWYGNNTDPLLYEFGFEKNHTAAYMSDSDDNEGVPAQPLYGLDNIANHSATIGVNMIQMFGSTAFTVIPEGATSLVTTDTDGTASWSLGGNVSGLSVVASLKYGLGRIVAFADGNFINDADADTDGIDFLEYNNRQLASSTMIWLSASGIPEKMVLFEQSHNPYYKLSSPYLMDLGRLLSFNGFNVRWTDTFSEQIVDEADVLFIMSGVENYTTPEKVMIYDFVARGGGLFLSCDWTGYQVMTNDIISEFGMDINGTSYLFDDDDGRLGALSYVAYTGPNIGDHPITQQVWRIEIDRGPGFAAIGSGTALVSTDDDGTSHWFAGGAADNVPVIATTEYGMGRVVVLPDINFFSYTDGDGDGYSHLYDSDNDILLANSFYWFIENRAPIVDLVFPNGGELLNGTHIIEFTTADPNRDALSYEVFISDNNGSDWISLESGISGTADGVWVTWNTTLYDDGNSYMIRVIVSDGVLTSQDDSDTPFTLDNFEETTPPPGGGLNPMLLAIIGAGVVVVVIVLVILMKKKGGSGK